MYKNPRIKKIIDKAIDLTTKLRTPIVKLKLDSEGSTKLKVIKWWLENAENFPTLSPIALDIISAPVTEVALENNSLKASINT